MSAARGTGIRFSVSFATSTRQLVGRSERGNSRRSRPIADLGRGLGEVVYGDLAQ